MPSRTLTLLLLLGLGACPQNDTDTDTDTDADTDSDTDADTDSDTDTDTDSDTDVPYEGPWEEVVAMPDGGAWPAVGVLGTEIHVVPSNSTTHLVFDVASDTDWRTLAAAPEAAHYHTGAALDGVFYVMGGGSPGAIDSVDWNFAYDVDGDSWTDELAPVPTPRGYVNSAVVGGEIFVIGGPNISGETYNRTLEAYDPVEDTWRSGALLPSGTMWPLYSAIGVVDDRIYKMGGGIANNPFDTAYAYDVGDDEWVELTDSPVLNHGPAGVALDRRIYMIGGYLDDGITDGVWIYDVDGDTWSDGPALPYPVAYSKAVAVDGCIYLIGGHDNANDDARLTFLTWCPE